MEIKVLMDNVSRGDLLSEWGLSVYIEYGQKHILLDGGTTGEFVKNAQTMGVDLSQIDFAVLSHAHYDHADGLEAFFEKNGHAKVYLREGAEENCYKETEEGYKYIGIKPGLLQRYASRFQFINGDFSPEPGIFLLPHKSEGMEEAGKKARMFVKKGDQWQQDAFAHEQSLVFDTRKGLVIFNSCSHGGADKILEEVSKTFPEKKIYALFGGLHLHATGEEDVRILAGKIRDREIKKIFTGHCTGEEALHVLQDELGEMVEGFYSGFTLKI